MNVAYSYTKQREVRELSLFINLIVLRGEVNGVEHEEHVHLYVQRKIKLVFYSSLDALIDTALDLMAYVSGSPPAMRQSVFNSS